MTEKEKKKPKQVKISPDEWKQQNNISDYDYAGFQANLTNESYKESDLNKLFKEYQNAPFFEVDKGGK